MKAPQCLKCNEDHLEKVFVLSVCFLENKTSYPQEVNVCLQHISVNFSIINNQWKIN